MQFICQCTGAYNLFLPLSQTFRWQGFTFSLGLGYALRILDMRTVIKGSEVARNKKLTPQARQEMTGMERLGLRVSSMINHPIAQSQRWVTIHRLDTDGDMEWEEVMGLLVETPELDLTFNDDDSVTVRWEAQSPGDRDDLVVPKDWEDEKLEEEAPF